MKPPIIVRAKSRITAVIPAKAGIYTNNYLYGSRIKYGMTKVTSRFAFGSLRRIIPGLLLTAYYLLLTTPTYADCVTQPGKGVPIGDCFGFGNIHSLGEASSRLVNPAFSIATVMVVIYLLVGAFKYLNSGGDKEAIDAARKMMTHAFIGFLILMLAFLALKYLLFTLFGITGEFEIINSK